MVRRSVGWASRATKPSSTSRSARPVIAPLVTIMRREASDIVRTPPARSIWASRSKRASEMPNASDDPALKRQFDPAGAAQQPQPDADLQMLGAGARAIGGDRRAGALARLAGSAGRRALGRRSLG